MKKAAPDGELSEQDFMDWYVICKYTDAIIPPEDSGYPVFKTEHTSAMAQVTPCPPLVLAFSLSRVNPSHRPVLSLPPYGARCATRAGPAPHAPDLRHVGAPPHPPRPGNTLSI